MRAEATLTILKLLFLAVAALVAADLVMTTWKTRLEGSPATTLVTPAATASANAAPVEQIIADVTPLVGTATPKPLTDSSAAKGPAAPAGPAPIQDPSATMKLDGTVMAGPASIAFIEVGGKQVSAHLSDVLSSDYTVVGIHDTNVVFKVQDEQRTLWLPSMQPKAVAAPIAPPPPVAASASPSSSASPQTTGPQKVTVSKAERDQVMQNPQGYMADLRVLPNTKDGKPYGAQVVYLKPGSFIGKLGMQQGDVLLTVGGNDVFKPEDAINAYFSLLKEDSVEVKIDRGGKVFPVDIEFR